MTRAVSVLLAFALASGETLSLAAPTVIRSVEAPVQPAAALGPLGLDAGTSLGAASGDLSPSIPPAVSPGMDLPPGSPALAASVPAAAGQVLPVVAAALVPRAPVSGARELFASPAGAAPAKKDAEEKDPARREGAAALDELRFAEQSEGDSSSAGGEAARKALYNGSALPVSKTPVDVEGQPGAAALGDLEAGRLNPAGSAPAAASAEPPAAVPAPEGPFKTHLRNALFLGITAAMFIPVFSGSARLISILYATPTALALAGILGAVLFGPRALVWLAWNAPIEAFRLVFSPRATFAKRLEQARGLSSAAYPVLGAAVGLALAVLPWILFSSGSVVLFHAALLTFVAAAAAWAGYEAFRMLRPLLRPPARLAGWLTPARVKALFRFPWLKKGAVLFTLGLLPGLAAGLAPFFISVEATEVLGYAGTALLLAAGALWTLSALAGMLFDAARWLWRDRRDLSKHKSGVMDYAARLLLGLALGAAPLFFFNTISNMEARVMEVAARKLSADDALMRRLPDHWRWLVWSMAEPLEFREMGSDAVFFDGPPGTTRGRLDSKTLARVYLPPGSEGKRLTILISGNQRTLDEPQNRYYQSQIAFVYYTLKARGEPVVWFRSGNALHQLRGQTAPGVRVVEDAGEVTERTRTIARDVIRVQHPSSVSIVGFSWGGGRIVDLSEDQGWLQGTPVDRTIAIDPIRTSLAYMGMPETRRPDFRGNRHLQLYQLAPGRIDLWNAGSAGQARAWFVDFWRAQFDIHGAPVAQVCEGDHCEEVPGVDHRTIDYDESVRAAILRHLLP